MDQLEIEKLLGTAVTVNEFSDTVVKLIDEKFNSKESFVVKNKVDIGVKQKAAKDAALKREEAGLPPIEKIDYEFGAMAYRHKLDDCFSTPRQTLELAANEFGKDMEWVDDMKHQKWPHNRRITIEYSEDIVKFEHKDLVRDCIADATTLNRGLTVLHKFQEIDRSLKLMRAEIDELKKAQRKIEVKQISTEVDIETLFSNTGVQQLSTQERARVMKDKGVSMNSIAKELKVDRSTVRRWLKNV